MTYWGQIWKENTADSISYSQNDALIRKTMRRRCSALSSRAAQGSLGSYRLMMSASKALQCGGRVSHKVPLFREAWKNASRTFTEHFTHRSRGRNLTVEDCTLRSWAPQWYGTGSSCDCRQFFDPAGHGDTYYALALPHILSTVSCSPRPCFRLSYQHIRGRTRLALSTSKSLASPAESTMPFSKTAVTLPSK